MRSTLRLRFDYGSIVPWVRRSDGHRVAVAGPDSVWLRSEPDRCTPGARTSRTHSEFTVERGRDRSRSCSPGTPRTSRARTSSTRTRRCSTALGGLGGVVGALPLRGPAPGRRLRSLITLKALTYAPTGGIVAAPTTSLPEELGGVRNWDYRYCWLRDSTLTLGALLSAGYRGGGRGLARLAAARGRRATPPTCRSCTASSGERRLPEFGAAVAGRIRGLQPGTDRQRRPCTSSSSTCTARSSTRSRWPGEAGLPDQAARLGLQLALLDFLESTWRQPDEGLWEVRGPRRHFVHSKVMAWVAADRAVRTLEDEPVAERRRRTVARDARRGAPGGVRAGLRPGAQHLHAVLRLPRTRRRAAADPPRRLPAARRPARRRHGRRGPGRARPATVWCAATARRGRRSTGCRAARARSWPARSGSRTRCT